MGLLIFLNTSIFKIFNFADIIGYNTILVLGVQHNDSIFEYILRMIATMNLVNPNHMESQKTFCFVIRTFTIYFLSNFQNIKNCISNYSLHAVYYNFMTFSLYLEVCTF